MTTARILIVEDEPIIADDIAMILEKHQYRIVDIVSDAEEALAILSEIETDLALLDINIDGDMDGIGLAHRINKDFGVPFVFLTSYYDDNTIKRARATDPAGYVVKPFDEGDLRANVELAISKKNGAHIMPHVEKFFVRDKSELKAIEASDILYAESDDNYTNIFTEERKYVVSHTLKSVEGKLTGQGFLRVHKSYLINFRKISSIAEGYAFIEQVKVPIGRAYRDNLLRDLPIL